VENRKARPKIVQNAFDQGTAFFSKQANILNSSQKRHRRGVSSPGTEFLFLNSNEHILNQSAILHTDHKKISSVEDRDQFNFTFFKERGAAAEATAN